jgi:hypothetical protein
MKRSLILVYILILGQISCAQGDNFKFVSNLKVNEKKVRNSKEGKKETLYLGDIKNEKGKSLFHIVSQYSFVKATSHGFSTIYYLDEGYNVIQHYELGNPEELPFQLLDNQLYFNYTDEEGNKRVFVNKVGSSLPKTICVAPKNCY